MKSKQESTGEATAIVTGASSGIGEGIAQSLLQQGYRVIGLARDFTKSELEHPNYLKQAVDLGDAGQLAVALKEVAQCISGPLKVLVNNAGIGIMGNLEQLSSTAIRRQMDVNFLSHALVTREFLPQMKKAGGTIVFIGSESALNGSPQGSIYCASKFAIRGFAQALRLECAKADVRISLVNPGAVRTGFFDTLSFEPGAEEANVVTVADVVASVDMAIQASPGANFDEINLRPLKSVWKRK